MQLQKLGFPCILEAAKSFDLFIATTFSRHAIPVKFIPEIPLNLRSIKNSQETAALKKNFTGIA
jgi:hypothetical protein